MIRAGRLLVAGSFIAVVAILAAGPTGNTVVGDADQIAPRVGLRGGGEIEFRIRVEQ